MTNSILAFVVGCCLIAASQFNAKVPEFKQELNMIPPLPDIKHWSLGYDEVLSDSLWLRLIQDFHVCENARDGIAHRAGESHQGYLCSKGWVYKMLDAITDLTPLWKTPYVMGGTLLSVVVDDRDGATAIFKKGIQHFPDDYTLLYRASYHFIWEEKDPKFAAELLIRAAKNGGPEWFYSLAGKLYSQAGQAALAKGILEDAIATAKSDDVKVRLENRLREVNKTLRDEAMKK